jgi:hypothetical protein
MSIVKGYLAVRFCALSFVPQIPQRGIVAKLFQGERLLQAWDRALGPPGVVAAFIISSLEMDRVSA